MSDETRAVPTSADIEAIRQRDYETRHSPFIVGGRQAIEDRRALLAAIDGERRHRADLERLERQLEEAVKEARRHISTLVMLDLDLGHACPWCSQHAMHAQMCPKWAADRWLLESRFLAREVVEEAETP